MEIEFFEEVQPMLSCAKEHYSAPPQVNGQPLDYQPAKVYDSPFLQSDFGSGILTVHSGSRSAVLDFNAP